MVTADVVAHKMAGPAIRAWHIAGTLATEHDVKLVTTSPGCELSSPGFEVRSASAGDLRRIEAWAEVLVVQGFLLADHPVLASSSKVMVVDLYDPIHLEGLELHREGGDHLRQGAVRDATVTLNEQLRRGDFFLCATAKQRDFWLGHLAALGRLNPWTYDADATLQSLIAVAPFGLDEDPARHTRPALKGVVPGIAEADEVLLWGGGVYNWFDPLTLIRAVDRLRARRPRVRLFFLGAGHPNPDVPEMHMAVAARRLADQLGLTGGHVFFNEEWVAYEDRQNYLLEADVGVSTHLSHLETMYSFRTRILDYLWAGLPVVATQGDAFAELVDSAGLGFTVPPGDAEALEAALHRVLDDPEEAARCRANVESVRPGFRWPVVLGPLTDFCRSPRRAPDLADRRMAPVLGRTRLSRSRTWRSLRRDVILVRQRLRSGGPSGLVAGARSRLARRRGSPDR